MSQDRSTQDQQIPTPNLNWVKIRSQWGADGWAALSAIKTGDYKKKRRTILLLAAHRSLGLPITPVFDRADSAAKRTHYGKFKQDPAYRAACEFFLGKKGVATVNYNRQVEELELDALAQIERARIEIASMTHETVGVLRAGLSAEKRTIATGKDEILLDEMDIDYAERRQTVALIHKLSAQQTPATTQPDPTPATVQPQAASAARARYLARLARGDEGGDEGGADSAE